MVGEARGLWYETYVVGDQFAGCDAGERENGSEVCGVCVGERKG